MAQDRAQTIARLNDEFRRVAVDAALGQAAPDQVPGGWSSPAAWLHFPSRIRSPCCK